MWKSNEIGGAESDDYPTEHEYCPKCCGALAEPPRVVPRFGAFSELRKAALLHAEFGVVVGAAATCGCDRLIFVKS